MAGPPNNHDRRRNSEFQISESLNHTVDKSKSSFIRKAEPRLLSSPEFCSTRIESALRCKNTLISSDTKLKDCRAYQASAFDTFLSPNKTKWSCCWDICRSIVT